MAAQPDQPAAEVQQLATDEFNTINRELGERLADRMVAPATAVEAYDGSPTSSISMLSEAREPAAEQGDFHQLDDTIMDVPAAASEHAGSTTDEEMFSSVHHSPDGSMADDEDDEWQPALVGGQPTPPSTTPVPSRAERLQSVAVGDGDTQGGGSYLLDGSDISPPQPRRTASGSDELLAPRLAEQDARLDKLETAVSGLANRHLYRGIKVDRHGCLRGTNYDQVEEIRAHTDSNATIFIPHRAATTTTTLRPAQRALHHRHRQLRTGRWRYFLRERRGPRLFWHDSLVWMG